ncbi:unnamed protein product [Mytilus coruscus]|uniref:Reverse transcriptase domain-containing protein n=1 Tax=Mytilus coruscus TaxID=42192 RepID=A0A6J8CGA4_MYTCO|nr:unnamed protein product [Mytilus coruscus]
MQPSPSIKEPCLFDQNGNPSSDHLALFTSLTIAKPPKQRHTVSYRKFSDIKTTDFIQDLNTSKIVQNHEGKQYYIKWCSKTTDQTQITFHFKDTGKGCRQENHINSHTFHGSVQSAYRACHSTETALLRVHHDIAYALDNNCCTLLFMLDLSAAFDIIDHQIPFNRLEYFFGITGDALLWLQSYLMNRTQHAVIGSV